MALMEAEKVPFVDTTKIQLSLPITEVGGIYQLIQQYQSSTEFSRFLQNLGEEYINSKPDGDYDTVRVTLVLPTVDVGVIVSKFNDITKGNGGVLKLDESDSSS